MGVTFKLVFNRLGKKNKKGIYPIHIRVTIDRKTDYINTEEKISENFWSGKQNKWIKETFPGSFELNSLLQNKLSDLDKYILKLKLYNTPVTFEIIKDFYNKKSDFTILNDYVEYYIVNVKGLKYRTIQSYRTFQTHLNDFNPRIKFKDLSLDLINSLKNYMFEELKLSGSTIDKYFDNFKKICAASAKQNCIDPSKNPFVNSDFKIKVEKAKRTYLEINEIKKIIDLKFPDLTKSLEVHRDHFLFLIYSGFYYNDLKVLNKSELHSYNESYYILADRYKNENPSLVPLYKFPHAIELIKKYDTPGTDLVFPTTISEPKFNENLKTIARLAGIKKNLTNKVARHSSAQLWMSKGIERQFLSKILGHTQEETTQEYYNLSIFDIDKRIKDFVFSEFEQ